MVGWFATKFVLIYRRPLGEHQDKTPASNLFPPHSIKTVTRTASVWAIWTYLKIF